MLRPFPLRRHQAEAFAAVEDALAEDRSRLWVTLPPGAGKTLVGTDVAVLLSRPAVVFSPNTAIQGQWAQTWNSYGGPPAGTDRALSSGFTSLTYQSLAVFDGEDSATDLIDRLHPNGLALIAALRAAGPITLILDECHHLLEVWGQLLREVLEELPDAVVLGLTATPPGAMTKGQTALAATLFGPILYEARIPSLVKEGTLAPYAELAWLVEPTPQESEWLAAQSTRFLELTTDLFDPSFGSTPFAEWLRVRFVEAPEGWERLASKDPELTDAALRLVHASLLALPPGARLREPHRHPLSAEDWVLLLDDWLTRCIVAGGLPEDDAVLDAVRRTLPSVGYVWTRKGVRRGRGTVDRVLARSSAKEQAVATILGAEQAGLGDDTRALVLTDHAQAAATTDQRLTSAAPAPAGSAVGVLLTLLADPGTAALNPLLVTGTTVAASAETLTALRDVVRAADPALGDRLVVESQSHPPTLTGPWSSGQWVPWVTRFFTSGETRALVGTRGLLGEGWDCPAVSTLVDLTSVTTATSVVQTRGRALRIDPARPDKVALIWTVVCVSDQHVAGAADWSRFVRKHVGYFTADESGTVVDGVAGIDSGFSAFEPPPVDSFDTIDARMLRRAEDRPAVRDQWLSSRAYADVVTHTVRVRSRRRDPDPTTGPVPVALHPSALVARDDRPGPWRASWPAGVALVASAVATLVAAGPEVAVGVGSLAAVLTQAGVASVRGRRLVADAARPPSLEQVGRALADAMLAVGLSSVGAPGVRTDVRPDGSLTVWLSDVPEATSAAFATAFEEIVSPMTDPRWVVPRWVTSPPPSGLRGLSTGWRAALGRHRPDGEVWHTVPARLAGSRARADAFAEAWDHWVGGGPAMSTRDPEAEGILVTHRGEDPFAATCVVRRVWS